jgi:hypothetical protein
LKSFYPHRRTPGRHAGAVRNPVRDCTEIEFPESFESVVLRFYQTDWWRA